MAATEKSLKVSADVHQALMAIKAAEGLTVSDLVSRAIAAYQANGLPAELPPSVNEAIEQGADLQKLMADGLNWAAKQYLGRAKAQQQAGESGLGSLSDVEIETIPTAKAKQMAGLTIARLQRMVDRLETWNAAQVDRNRQVKITASYLLDLRDHLKDLTGGKIKGLSRNDVYAYFNAEGSAIAPQDLGPRHNATVGAIDLGVQCFRDLIEAIGVDPTEELRFQKSLQK